VRAYMLVDRQLSGITKSMDLECVSVYSVALFVDGYIR
jgi:hypothetical protein